MAKFQPFKLPTSRINSLPIKDGQLIIDTDTKKIYIDDNSTRKEIASPYTEKNGSRTIIDTESTECGIFTFDPSKVYKRGDLVIGQPFGHSSVGPALFICVASTYAGPWYNAKGRFYPILAHGITVMPFGYREKPIYYPGELVTYDNKLYMCKLSYSYNESSPLYPNEHPEYWFCLEKQEIDLSPYATVDELDETNMLLMDVYQIVDGLNSALSYTLAGEPFENKTFSECTDQEFVNMINAHYNNETDITQYWNIGDTRTIHLNAIPAASINGSTYQYEAYEAQDIEIEILDFDHDDLVTPINGHTKAAVTVKCKYLLGQHPVRYTYNTGTGNVYWDITDRRIWLNNNFKASLSFPLQYCLKTVFKKSIYSVWYDGATAAMRDTQDEIFLISIAENGRNGWTDSDWTSQFNGKPKSFLADGTQYALYANKATDEDFLMAFNLDKDNKQFYDWQRSSETSSNLSSVQDNLITSNGFVPYYNEELCGLAPTFCF